MTADPFSLASVVFMYLLAVARCASEAVRLGCGEGKGAWEGSLEERQGLRAVLGIFTLLDLTFQNPLGQSNALLESSAMRRTDMANGSPKHPSVGVGLDGWMGGDVIAPQSLDSPSLPQV
ncbi:hypothetical protein BDK51DRAFT_41121 [Blyttiomyces helicus]|uniref:Uncharacterized protein n=1 Tax=Blyttiomyces helicus TaxID=388810 RepID=A0A4V1IQ35_9FUNG|nr:hypothetical protein BDK51DRAFT_41121 [Blyttiomyces helicus]|eukprot:RKO85177.1 hypothetical protein BDK51DRAFT_41121 [Blyttiomyces helicus]